MMRATSWPAATRTTTHRTTQETQINRMTSLSIRLTVPLREVIGRGALAQRTAAARASREHHVHSPCRYAIEACCSLCFVAKLASHCSHRTSAKAHARAHVSINMPCSDAWLEAGMRGSDTSGEQREQRERRRARWPSMPHTCWPRCSAPQNEGAHHSSAVQYFCTGSSTGSGRHLSSLPVEQAGCMA